MLVPGEDALIEKAFAVFMMKTSQRVNLRVRLAGDNISLWKGLIGMKIKSMID